MSGENEITNQELARDINRMTQGISELTSAVKALAEADVRREERELRQEELNRRTDKRLTGLEEFKRDIEIKRATEAQGMEFLKKYWWVIMLLGSYVVYMVTKGSVTITP